MTPLAGRIPIVLPVAILAAALGVSAARAQVSPGPLAAPHQELDSALKCFACHGKKGEEAMRERCLACHKEVGWLVERGRGLHGQKGMDKCATCHPDHAGREFAMIAWPEGGPEKFDHQRAGWTLAGKHAGLKCDQCHKPEFQVSESIRLSGRKDKGKSLLGLETTCGSCHTKDDVHRGALGQDCSKCHTDTAWKPTTHFDHAQTDYPLTGRHVQVECAKCHLAPSLKLQKDANGKPIPLYKPLPHQECSACHADPHQGKLGPACARCHVTDTWKKVDPNRFDHDKTRYPLRGRHASIKCAQCHDDHTAWGKKPPFAACTSCHADAAKGHADPHAGLATLAGKPADCAACHNEQGFKPSTYTVQQHRTSGYPLEGKHATLKCDACHRKNPAGIAPAKLGSSGVLIRMAHARCRDCHEDAHKGQFAKRPDGGACEPCHKVEGWKPSLFTAKEHARLRLPLAGRHAEVACAACHGPDRRGLPPLPGADVLGSARVALVLREIDCIACHVDPHEGRFGPKGVRAKDKGCLACHDLKAFRPSTVDVAAHRTFGYALEGAHRAVPCNTCHRETAPAPMTSSLVLPARAVPRLAFAVKDQRCENCHKNPHGTQFARRKDKGACESCHNEDVFRPASRFDHERDAAFKLEGGHANVPCARCHPSKRDASGKLMVIYQPVPKECKACHGARTPAPLKGAGTAGASAPPVRSSNAPARAGEGEGRG